MSKSTAMGFLLALALTGAASPSSGLEESSLFASSPARAKTSSARLLAGDPGPDGTYLAGVEIDLAPGAVTYWRQPGDAGEPPRFDFSGSRNVAKVEPLYPAPKHLEEAGSLVAGYDSKVIFPLRVTATDKAAPVGLRLDLNYAACQTLCLPARASLALDLPQSGESPFAGELSRALALAPRPLTREEAAARLQISPRSVAPRAWTLRYLGPERLLDVFAEAPDPLFLDATRAERGEDFILTLATNGATPPPALPGVLTLVTERGAVEAAVELR